MCGIAGIRTFDEYDPSILKRRVTQQLDLLEHRGRDESGLYVEKGFCMGITRLSIIDPVGGTQPIQSRCGRFVIAYNGEVYNFITLRSTYEKRGYSFKTKTDTEVVLAAFVLDGPRGVLDLNGMFSFAVWDRKERELFLCRDRFGIKPLFYYSKKGHFVFASEIKGILAVNRNAATIDPQGLATYLSHNYLPPPYTLFRSVIQLRPGHAVRVKADGTISDWHWHRPICVEGTSLSTEEIDQRFQELFEQSVERQLISDVPLGAFLSGGLDSTAIVSVMAEKKTQRVKTYSIGFAEQDYDETPYADEVAKQLNTDHHVTRLGGNAFFKIFETYIKHMDNLVADQATVPMLELSTMARKDVKVCLAGDGGDEILSGYITILADRFQPWIRRCPPALHKMVEHFLNRRDAGMGKLSFDYRLKAFLKGAGMNREDAHATWRLLYSNQGLRRLLGDAVRIQEDWIYSPYREAFQAHSHLGFFERAERADMAMWLAGNGLPKVDTMTMAANLEARVPFLDNDLVDFLLSIPGSKKVRGLNLKIILRRYLRKKGFSSSIVDRKKEGFHSPIAVWFKGPLSGKLKELFSDQRTLYRDGIIREGEPMLLLDEHMHGRANHAFQLFGLALLFLWYENVFTIVPQDP